MTISVVRSWPHHHKIFSLTQTIHTETWYVVSMGPQEYYKPPVTMNVSSHIIKILIETVRLVKKSNQVEQDLIGPLDPQSTHIAAPIGD